MTKRAFTRRSEVRIPALVMKGGAGAITILNFFLMLANIILTDGENRAAMTVMYGILAFLGAMVLFRSGLFSSVLLFVFYFGMVYYGSQRGGAATVSICMAIIAAASLICNIIIHIKWTAHERAAEEGKRSDILEEGGELKPGDLWNGWTVDSVIGKGSFGKVYKIVRKDFDHEYESALKVMRIPVDEADIATIRDTGMDDENVRTYFYGIVKELVREFEIMSEMRGHSNIVSYEDHSVLEMKNGFGWVICIRMELLTPLTAIMRRRKLAAGEIIQLGIDMCRALEMCQRYNIIHRDIKPQNIFVSKQDSYKLGDFGVARHMDRTVTEMSQKGTYIFMAPEVYKGNKYDATVDIYSLGLVMYRLFNFNRAPFMPKYPQPITHEEAEKANARRLAGEQLPPPAEAGGRLAEIILKACAYDPADRYQTPTDFRLDLQQVFDDEPAYYIVPNPARPDIAIAGSKGPESKEPESKEPDCTDINGSEEENLDNVNTAELMWRKEGWE